MIEDKVIQKAISRSKREKVEIKYFSELPKLNETPDFQRVVSEERVKNITNKKNK